MKEPDIKSIRNKLNIPDVYKFMGYVVFDFYNRVFLLDYLPNIGISSSRFVPIPDNAKKFTRYKKAVRTIKSLEMEKRFIIVLLFESGETIFYIDMPSYFEMVN